MPRIYLTVGEVLEIHRELIESYGGIHGLRDARLLESAVFRPQIGYYHTVVEEAAALMRQGTTQGVGIADTPTAAATARVAKMRRGLTSICLCWWGVGK